MSFIQQFSDLHTPRTFTAHSFHEEVDQKFSSCHETADHIIRNTLKEKPILFILFSYERALLRNSLILSKEYEHIFIELCGNSCSGNFKVKKKKSPSVSETLAQTETKYCRSRNDELIKS